MTFAEIYLKTRNDLVDILLEALRRPTNEIDIEAIDEIFKEEGGEKCQKN